MVFVPKHDYFLTKILLEGILHISVAIRAGEYNNAKFHDEKLIRKGKCCPVKALANF